MEVVAEVNLKHVDLRKESLSSTPSRSLLKKFTMESKPRLLLTVRESALVAMVLEVKKALSRSVELARDVVWSPRWSSSVLACTLSLKDLVMNAVEREKSSMRRINVKFAMERRSAKRRKLLKLKSIKVLLMAITTYSMEKLMNSLALSPVMSSLLLKKCLTRLSSVRELICSLRKKLLFLKPSLESTLLLPTSMVPSLELRTNLGSLLSLMN